MNLEEIVDIVSQFASDASERMLDDNRIGAYDALDSLHDVMLDHFVELPKPDPN